MQLPELDQEAIEVQPLPKILFSDGSPNVCTGTDEGGVETHMNRDSSKLSMFGRDGLECKGDPYDGQRSGPKNCIHEFCRFREVNGSQGGVSYKEGKLQPRRRTKTYRAEDT